MCKCVVGAKMRSNKVVELKESAFNAISSQKSEATLQPQPSKKICLVFGLLDATACPRVSKTI